jgi:hypothetical protein
VLASRRVRRLALPTVLFLILVAGCPSAAFRRADHLDTADGWRALLASHDANASELDHARERLEDLTWTAALAENTPRDYRLFIDEFPDSDHKDEAQGRLAALRYNVAERSAGRESLSGFLEDEPAGPLASNARSQLADIEYAAAVKARGPAPIELYLARYPAGPHLEEAQALEDERSFEAAAAKGTLGLVGYVAEHPQGRHRAEAEGRVLSARVEALIDEERFDEAANGLRAAVVVPDRQTLVDALAAGRRRAQLAAMDAIEGLPKGELEALQQLSFQLARPDRATVGQLAERLDDLDPAQRWRAAAELGASGSIWALDPLLAAAARSRFWKVRLVASRAVGELLAALPPMARQEEIARRVTELRPLVASAELSDEVGLLEDAAGDLEAARLAFAQSRRFTQADLLATEEGMRLAWQAGDHAAALTLAHDLGTEAVAYADDHLREEGLPPILADRQLCGLVDLAKDALQTLTDAKEGGAIWQPAAKAQATRLEDMLAEMERTAALEDAHFTGCSQEAPPASAATDRRLEAVGSLASKARGASAAEADAIHAVLEEAAAHDGSKRVREAAQQALNAP